MFRFSPNCCCGKVVCSMPELPEASCIFSGPLMSFEDVRFITESDWRATDQLLPRFDVGKSSDYVGYIHCEEDVSTPFYGYFLSIRVQLWSLNIKTEVAEVVREASFVISQRGLVSDISTTGGYGFVYFVNNILTNGVNSGSVRIGNRLVWASIYLDVMDAIPAGTELDNYPPRTDVLLKHTATAQCPGPACNLGDETIAMAQDEFETSFFPSEYRFPCTAYYKEYKKEDVQYSHPTSYNGIYHYWVLSGSADKMIFDNDGYLCRDMLGTRVSTSAADKIFIRFGQQITTETLEGSGIFEATLQDVVKKYLVLDYDGTLSTDNLVFGRATFSIDSPTVEIDDLGGSIFNSHQVFVALRHSYGSSFGYAGSERINSEQDVFRIRHASPGYSGNIIRRYDDLSSYLSMYPRYDSISQTNAIYRSNDLYATPISNVICDQYEEETDSIDIELPITSFHLFYQLQIQSSQIGNVDDSFIEENLKDQVLIYERMGCKIL